VVTLMEIAKCCNVVLKVEVQNYILVPVRAKMLSILAMTIVQARFCSRHIMNLFARCMRKEMRARQNFEVATMQNRKSGNADSK